MLVKKISAVRNIQISSKVSLASDKIFDILGVSLESSWAEKENERHKIDNLLLFKLSRAVNRVLLYFSRC
jgi:hypothetical protein